MLVNAADGEYLEWLLLSVLLQPEVHGMPSKRWKWIVRLIVVLIVGIGVVRMLGGARPTNLGVKNGQLAACPEKPNCVSTQATDEGHQIQPLTFDSEQDAMVAAVRDALAKFPRTQIITDADGYFHAECTSLICRYVDDLEVWIDGEARLVHARSASRVGYSDLGVNRKRVEQLFAAIQAN